MCFRRASQQRQQTLAVKRRLGRGLDANRVQRRGQDVNRDDGRVDRSGASEPRGPADNKRSPDATFFQTALDLASLVVARLEIILSLALPPLASSSRGVILSDMVLTALAPMASRTSTIT